MLDGVVRRVARRSWHSLSIAIACSLAGHAITLATWPQRSKTVETASGAALTALIVADPATTPKGRSQMDQRRAAGADHRGQGLGLPPRVVRQQSLPSIAGTPVSVEYVPSHQLAPGPEVLGTVDVLRPKGDDTSGEVTLYLSVFISELGVVDNVEVDEKDLHPRFAEVAMRAFGSARFNPGRMHGRAVRSLMRVEVVFEPVDRAVSGK